MDGTFGSYRQPDGTFRSYQGTPGYFQDHSGHESISSQNSWVSGPGTSEEMYPTTDNTSVYQYRQPMTSSYHNHHPPSSHASTNPQPVYEHYLVPSTPSTSIQTGYNTNHSTGQAIEWTELDTRSGRRLRNWYEYEGIEQGGVDDRSLRVALGEALKAGENSVLFREQTVRVRRCEEPMKHDRVCNAVLVLPKANGKSAWAKLQCYRCLTRNTMKRTREERKKGREAVQDLREGSVRQ